MAYASRSDDGKAPELEARFRAVFAAELAWMWTTLRRLGVREADLEDVTHDVFLAVYRKLDAYDAERPLRPWLFAFAYRAASDYRRLARHREQPAAEMPEVEADEGRADDVLAQLEDHQLLHAALAGIDIDRRAVLVAHEIDGTSMKDIAAALGIPLHTAYSRLRVAREELTRAIGRLRARQRTPRGEA